MNNCQTTKNFDLEKETTDEGKVRESCLLDKIRWVCQRKEFKIVKSFLSGGIVGLFLTYSSFNFDVMFSEAWSRGLILFIILVFSFASVGIDFICPKFKKGFMKGGVITFAVVTAITGGMYLYSSICAVVVGLVVGGLKCWNFNRKSNEERDETRQNSWF
jgi:hypothetical protein